MLNLNNFKIQHSDLLQKQIGNKNFYILFLGRLSDVKDLNFLLDLWASKFQDFENIKLIIAGEGEKKEKYLKIAKQTCHNNPPYFLGEISSDSIPLLISSANICILCSKHEASPTVIKESLSCGIPIVTNLVGDVQDFVINYKNGFILKKDHDSYYNAITYLKENPISKEEVYENSMKSLKKCSIEYVADEYFKIYDRLVNITAH